MNKETRAIHTQFQSPDAYGSLSMRGYHTVTYFENKVKDIQKGDKSL